MLLAKRNKQVRRGFSPNRLDIRFVSPSGKGARSGVKVKRKMRNEVTAAVLCICTYLFFSPIFVFGQQDKVDSSADKIYYFIDADCDHCSIADHKNTKIWIATNRTYTGSLDERAIVLKKFQDAVGLEFKSDSALIQRAVFRFQDSEEKIKETYAAKYAKMKARGYVVIKTEFDF
ncbi:MAG TPA: hypothetical protein VEV83_18965 [Parafilimonas sp.]|nr:hypothetical protein [Parafilimonas sp.]